MLQNRNYSIAYPKQRMIMSLLYMKDDLRIPLKLWVGLCHIMKDISHALLKILVWIVTLLMFQKYF